MTTEHDWVNCPDSNEGRGCDKCDDVINAAALAAGHDDACSYTIKATAFEQMEHFKTKQPECEYFTTERKVWVVIFEHPDGHEVSQSVIAFETAEAAARFGAVMDAKMATEEGETFWSEGLTVSEPFEVLTSDKDPEALAEEIWSNLLDHGEVY